jgi:hypothetical protein
VREFGRVSAGDRILHALVADHRDTSGVRGGCRQLNSVFCGEQIRQLNRRTTAQSAIYGGVNVRLCAAGVDKHSPCFVSNTRQLKVGHAKPPRTRGCFQFNFKGRICYKLSLTSIFLRTEPAPMPHNIVPEKPVQGRELLLQNAATNFWGLTPTAAFHQFFPNVVHFDHKIALIQKDKRSRERGFNPDHMGAGGAPLGPDGAVDGRSLTLQLDFAMDHRFADVLTAFNALGIVQIPHAGPARQGFTSPCGGGPFYGTVPAGYQNVSMTLPAILKFFKELGFTIQIDTGYPQKKGPVQNGLPPDVWAAVCAL